MRAAERRRLVQNRAGASRVARRQSRLRRREKRPRQRARRGVIHVSKLVGVRERVVQSETVSELANVGDGVVQRERRRVGGRIAPRRESRVPPRDRRAKRNVRRGRGDVAGRFRHVEEKRGVRGERGVHGTTFGVRARANERRATRRVDVARRVGVLLRRDGVRFRLREAIETRERLHRLGAKPRAQSVRVRLARGVSRGGRANAARGNPGRGTAADGF